MTTEVISFATTESAERARDALRAEGALLLPRACTHQACDELCRWIDAGSNSARCARHYADTEVRIWDAQQRHELADLFCRESDTFISMLRNSPSRAFTILAIRNEPIPAQAVDVRKGRWHIDSFRKQLKIFLFLTTTTLESGPFEYIPGTHSLGFKARMLLRGVYFRPRDFFTGSRAYRRLSDSLIEKLERSAYRSRPVLVPAGTAMIVDTSALHRARPCISAPRYALTAYYR